jgi:hypothetical protein
MRKSLIVSMIIGIVLFTGLAFAQMIQPGDAVVIKQNPSDLCGYPEIYGGIVDEVTLTTITYTNDNGTFTIPFANIQYVRRVEVVPLDKYIEVAPWD